MNTGQKIKQLRINSGLTQNDIAEKLFVSRELVSKWECNLRYPDEICAKKLSEIFGVTPDDIIEKNITVLKELSPCFKDENSVDSVLINGFLSSVSKRDRNIFIRRYYYFNGIAEISAGCGLSQQYVRTVLSRLRKKLKKYAEKGELK